MWAASIHPSIICREKTLCKAKDGGGSMNECSQRKLFVFPVKLSTPRIRRLECDREGNAMCHAMKGHWSKSKDPRTKGWLGMGAGRKGKRVETPSIHHPYVRKFKVSLALYTETMKAGRRRRS